MWEWNVELFHHLDKIMACGAVVIWYLNIGEETLSRPGASGCCIWGCPCMGNKYKYWNPHRGFIASKKLQQHIQKTYDKIWHLYFGVVHTFWVQMFGNFFLGLFWSCHGIAKATPAEAPATRIVVTVAWTKRWFTAGLLYVWAWLGASLILSCMPLCMFLCSAYKPIHSSAA